MAVGSIVDYLKNVKKDSSYSSRQNMAKQYGIDNYTGSAKQNTQLLNILREGKNGSSSPVQAGGNVGASGNSAGNGTQSQYMSGYNYQKYSPSENVQQYKNKLTGLENNRPDEFSSNYSGQVDDILDTIMNRSSFNENSVYKSDLYKNYRENYVQQGQKAMRDATGNAAALTGGYGSTYSAAVGQQAYDSYLSQLNDRSLDIRDRLYGKYQDEGKELYNQLNAVNNQDNIDYSRYRDTVGDYQWDLGYYDNRYNQEYGNDFGSYQSDLAAQQWAEQYAYQRGQDALAQQNWQTEFSYKKQQDAISNSLAKQKLSSKTDNALSKQKVAKLTDGEAQNYLYNVFKDTKSLPTASKEVQTLLKEGYIDESQINAMKYALSMMGRK
jgi:hypothetical protein